MHRLFSLVKEYASLVVLGLIALGIIALVSAPSIELPRSYPELAELATAKTTFSSQDYFDYYRRLAQDKGGEYAYEVLLRADMAPGTDIHLVAHVIGDVLYVQQGIEGIYICTQDFRNACSHSIVIGMLQENGEGSLPEIAKTCREAPGGRGAYTMCFHGLGHGVLAFNEYKFEKAVEMCAKTGTEEYGNREYIECVGGATMEMVAGVHDRDVWEREYPNYFKTSDPLYPCSASFMPKEVQPICYIHLTPRLFQAAGMDLGAPDSTRYDEAFGFCNALPSDDTANRSACYGGFGKEFTVLAQGRDVRDIGGTPEQVLKDVRGWCALAKNTAGEHDCNAYALSSLFWGGENTPDASFRFCEVAEGDDQNACYRQLTDHITYYLGSNTPERAALCERLPETYRASCLTRGQGQ